MNDGSPSKPGFYVVGIKPYISHCFDIVLVRSLAISLIDIND